MAQFLGLFILCCLGVPAFAEVAEACNGKPQDILVGGTVNLSDLENPGNLQSLLTDCKVGLYIHDYAWTRLPDNSDRQKVLKTFEGRTTAVELAATSKADQYWDQYYQQQYAAYGLTPSAVHINGSLKLSLDQWKRYVDAARRNKVNIVSPVFTPNGGKWRDDPFSSPTWDLVKNMAIYGRGITLDSPPSFFIRSEDGYRKFVMDELRWARTAGIESTFIISPGNSGTQFLADTKKLLNAIRVCECWPDLIVVENYEPLPARVSYANPIGNEQNGNSILGVGKWLAAVDRE